MVLDAGPFRVGLAAGDRVFLDTVRQFYGQAVIHGGSHIVDYQIQIRQPKSLRRWLRPQAVFEIEGMRPFEPQPLDHAFPMYEWGLNWCIATSAHRYLMLHAGTVAFGSNALIMPGNPGSGKSTLSAALSLRGGRLLSDEFGLLKPESVELLPMPRGVPLKNASIEAILDFDNEAPLGPTYPKTRKGRVRHLRPNALSLAAQSEPASPRWLVFPTYTQGAAENLVPMDKAEAFRNLAFNSFNYKLLGETAFRAIAAIIKQVDCYRFTYSSLHRAVPILKGLAGETA